MTRRKLSPKELVDRAHKAQLTAIRTAAYLARLNAIKWPIGQADHESIELLQTVCASWPSPGVVALREQINESP